MILDRHIYIKSKYVCVKSKTYPDTSTQCWSHRLTPRASPNFTLIWVCASVTFLVTVAKPWPISSRKTLLVLPHFEGAAYHSEAAGRAVSQPGSREPWTLVLSSLSPFYSAREPSLRDGAAISEWIFLLQWNLSGNSLTDRPRGVSTLCS